MLLKYLSVPALKKLILQKKLSHSGNLNNIFKWFRLIKSESDIWEMTVLALATVVGEEDGRLRHLWKQCRASGFSYSIFNFECGITIQIRYQHEVNIEVTSPIYFYPDPHVPDRTEPDLIFFLNGGSQLINADSQYNVWKFQKFSLLCFTIRVQVSLLAYTVLPRYRMTDMIIFCRDVSVLFLGWIFVRL